MQNETQKDELTLIIGAEFSESDIAIAAQVLAMLATEAMRFARETDGHPEQEMHLDAYRAVAPVRDKFAAVLAHMQNTFHKEPQT